jgi:hypothetical protein
MRDVEQRPAGPPLQPVTTRPARPAPPVEVAALTDLDPDLARFLPPDRASAARRDIPVRVITVKRGPWPVEPLASANPVRRSRLLA